MFRLNGTVYGVDLDKSLRSSRKKDRRKKDRQVVLVWVHGESRALNIILSYSFLSTILIRSNSFNISYFGKFIHPSINSRSSVNPKDRSDRSNVSGLTCLLTNKRPYKSTNTFNYYIVTIQTKTKDRFLLSSRRRNNLKLFIYWCRHRVVWVTQIKCDVLTLY